MHPDPDPLFYILLSLEFPINKYVVQKYNRPVEMFVRSELGK